MAAPAARAGPTDVQNALGVISTSFLKNATGPVGKDDEGIEWLLAEPPPAQHMLTQARLREARKQEEVLTRCMGISAT